MAVQGLTPDSFKNMQLNAGAFFVGLDSSTITASTTAEEFGAMLETANEAGKCIGATTGGGTFVATPEMRQIEADGMRAPIIGSTVIDSWEIKLTTTLKEITKKNLSLALTTSEVDPTTGAIMIRNNLVTEDYIPLFGWAGDLLDGRLIYIELQNVLNTVGTTLTFTDKGEGTIAVELRGHQANLSKMQYAPVNIWFFEKPTTPAAPVMP